MTNSNNWKKAVLPLTATLEDVLINMNLTGLKVVLFTNEDGSLHGIISDGDIRRCLLESFNIKNVITSLINTKALVLSNTADSEHALQFMINNHIQQVPIIDESGKLVGLHIWDEISTPKQLENYMVIMAGGVGSRMRPLTEDCPKPMLKVGGKPILERIIEHAKKGGIQNFIIAINYLGHLIEQHFGDGQKFEVNIEYVKETKPLGTGGALSLIKKTQKRPIIVSNGDLIMDINYRNMLNFHHKLSADATMAVRQYEWQHPFGVVETNGPDIVKFEEKPILRSNVNAGIYILSPEVLKTLEDNEKSDMPNIFDKLSKDNKRIVAFPMHEPWIDIGNISDLNQANKFLKKKV